MERSQHTKSALVLLLLLCLSPFCFAHTINYQLEKAPVYHVVSYYAQLGIRHIIPNGFDHILFMFGLCLLNTKWKTILLQATSFTIAHSITLALSMKGIFMLPSPIIEPLIALSIVFVAVENMILNELKPSRLLVVFLFGLLHGLGFASSLNEMGLPPDRFFTSLLSFNLGVEIGQVLVILVVFGLLVRPFKNKEHFRKRMIYPVSLAIALVASYWTLERVL